MGKFELTPRQRLSCWLGGAVLLWLAMRPQPAEPGVVRAEVTTIVLLVLSVALSLAANYLLRPKAPSITRDDKPTTLASRGAYVPFLLGRRRVGAVFLWAGDRTTKKEDTGGGKGGGKKQKTTVYYEGAMHGLCVGPAKRLHKIVQNGKAIFVGPIDAASHPSGTTVDLGKEGQFQIYWGEPHQPVNSTLGAGSRIGIASAWPYLCYVYWVTKRLGSTAQWQLIDYDVECGLESTRLAESASYLPPTRTLVVSPTYAITGATDGGPRVGKFVVGGHKANAFLPGSYLKPTGNSATSRDYRVYKAVNAFTGIFPALVPVTNIFLDDVLTGSNSSGTLQTYTTNEDDGYNHVHAFDQIVFEQWPHGAGLDRLEWDPDGLEELGRLCEAEGLRCSLFGQDGEEAKALAASIMQDVGFMAGMDPATGKIRPRAVRKPASTPANLGDNVLLPPKPEIDVLHDERQMDRTVYVFQDRELNFRDMTVTKDDDAEASELGRPKTRKVQLTTCTDFATASKIGERRTQEDMAGTVVYRLTASREARLLMPGIPFTASGLPGTLRCVSSRPDPMTGRVEVEALADYYGADSSTFVNKDTAYTLPIFRTDEDLAFTLLEIPAYLVSGKVMVAGMPRIRANTAIVSAQAHMSADNVTYTQVGAEFDVHTGGTLVATMNATDPSYQVQGPTINALGSDIANALDLTADTTNWRLGRQLALIDDELFFVQKLTSLGGGQYRLDGLIRARYDTKRAAHSSGTVVYLFTNDTLTTFQDILLSPGATRYLKSQPQGGQSLPLSEITPIQKVLRGKGITPMDPANLRVVGACNCYQTGTTVNFQWTYRSALIPKTGAGLQPAGGPCGVSPVDGQFQVQITTTGNVLKREFVTSGTSYAYSAADRTTDGLEGSDFKIRVKNVSSGYASDEIVTTVVKVT